MLMMMVMLVRTEGDRSEYVIYTLIAYRFRTLLQPKEM